MWPPDAGKTVPFEDLRIGRKSVLFSSCKVLCLGYAQNPGFLGEDHRARLPFWMVMHEKRRDGRNVLRILVSHACRQHHEDAKHGTVAGLNGDNKSVHTKVRGTRYLFGSSILIVASREVALGSENGHTAEGSAALC